MDNLENVRIKLCGLEDSIIFTALERSIYCFNSNDYTNGTFKTVMSSFENIILNNNGYTPIEEFPFFIENKKTAINDKFYQLYISNILPTICDNGNNNLIYAFEKDITLLRLVSRRIHLGIFVASAKYKADTLRYNNLIKKGNRDGIMTLLTDLKTEENVLKRVYDKSSIYIKGFDIKSEINLPEYFSSLYKDTIIPLTKSVELEYLMNIETEVKN